MLIIPAIDLKDGKCVRLKQGRMEDDTVFSDDPVGMATHWVEQGARRLHLVDLNGEFRPFSVGKWPFADREAERGHQGGSGKFGDRDLDGSRLPLAKVRQGNLGADIQIGREVAQGGGIDDLVAGDNTIFVATGVTDGGLVDGVRRDGPLIRTSSIVLRSTSGTVRRIAAEHLASKWW